MDFVRKTASIGSSPSPSIASRPPATWRPPSPSLPPSRENSPPPPPSASKKEQTNILVPPELQGTVVDVEDISEFNPSCYDIVPDEHTISAHGSRNLLALGIVVNTLLKCVICVECGEGVEPHALCVHARKHNPYHTASDPLVEELVGEYNLVTMDQVPYPDHSIRPLFGLAIHPEPLYFCGTCHRGFRTVPSLTSHQSSMARCDVSRKDRFSYRGYGQRLTNGKHRRFFPVDVSGLECRSTPDVDYSEMFSSTMPPPVDYSKVPIQDVEDKQNLSSFLFREGWLEAVQGYTASELNEATRLPTKYDAPWGKGLQMAAHRAMAHVQPLIGRQHGFGLTESIAQFYPV